MSTTKFILGTLLGAAIGVQVGILIAPDKGEKTRKKLSKKGNEYLDEVNGKMGHLLDGLTKKMTEASREVDKLAKNVKTKAEEITKAQQN